VSEAGRDQLALARVVAALEPYLDELVFVGGWAHRLYLLHGLARSPGFTTLMTQDADIAAPLNMRSRGERISQRLKEAGFIEEFKGDDTPPISEYRLGQEESGLYVEFLAPQLGSGRRRDGSPDDTVEIAGVSAQKLRHIDILLTAPWRVHLNEQHGFPLGPEGRDVLIPNPASYLAQKLLVLRQRSREKQAKDVLYVHDTLMMFSSALEELRACWAHQVAPSVHSNARVELERRRQEWFATVTDLSRNAARIAASTGRTSPPAPERLIQVCRLGLQEIFGP